ncbi:MAG TPA: family 16 glycoside hydrolase [Pirellulales bacterium]
MRVACPPLCAAIVLVGCVCSAEEFRPLFNGHDLTGWKVITAPAYGGYTEHWKIVNGLLTCSPGGNWLAADGEYENFEIKLEFRLARGGNSGVLLRCPLDGHPSVDGMEIQLLDDPAPQYAELKPYQYCGSLYGVEPAKRGATRPAGQWQSMTVLCDGTHVRVTLNDTVVVDTDTSQHADKLAEHPGLKRTRGHVGLQYHSTQVAFRNVAIRELPVGKQTSTAAEPAAEKMPGIEQSLVVSGQGYFPVALRLADGRIAVVLRGGAPHLGIKGRLDMVFSSDEGRSWTPPSVVVDSPADDRNPAFGQAADGALVVGFWRTETYDENGKWEVKSKRPMSTWVTRSIDGGQSWQQPTQIDVSDIGLGSPYGRIVTMPDGAMLMAIYGGTARHGDTGAGDGRPLDPYRNHSYVYRSTDNGRSWSRIAEIGDNRLQQLNETSLLLLPGGKLLAAVRSRGGDVYLADSSDGGRTWSSTTQITPAKVHPADLCLLADGRVLMTVGDRLQDYGVRAMVAAAGETPQWDRRRVLVDDSISADCGYPSSVLLRDGRVLTVYYSTAERDHRDWGVHCGAVIYRP